MEVPILYYNYRCHIRHYDDPNLRKIIQLHIQVCEEIGNRECLPVEGDLITLAFECKGEEQFFYDWLNEGAMHNGEIHFIYNEVEIADIFRFWDCFCVKIEEYMSVGNSPMMMVLYLSPGIIKRNNLEVREKVWKVSEFQGKQYTVNTKIMHEQIFDEQVCIIDTQGAPISDLLYYIECDGVKISSGRTDEKGMIPRIGGETFKKEFVIYVDTN